MSLRSTLATIGFAFACTLPLPASGTDYTDIWWASGGVESGWGVNFVQNEDVLFATFYIYDANGKAFWVSAPMFVTGSGTYVGDLNSSTGSFFGGAWAGASANKVGSATFSPTSATTGILTYSVSGVPGIPVSSVTKNIQRANFRNILLGGNYVGTGVVAVAGCSNSSNNATNVFNVDPQVAQDANGRLTITLKFGTETCAYAGSSIQEGQLFKIPGATYVCTIGSTPSLNTTANVYELRATPVGIEGRWQASTGSGCQENGTFSAVLN